MLLKEEVEQLFRHKLTLARDCEIQNMDRHGASVLYMDAMCLRRGRTFR
jgi:hypothetical protein